MVCAMNLIVPACAIFLALLLFWAVGCYNRLQALRSFAWVDMQRCLDAWALRTTAARALLRLLDAYLQHERAALAEVDRALNAQQNAAERVRTERLQAAALEALAVREAQLQEQLQSLRLLASDYAGLAVNAQLLAMWAQLDANSDSATHLLRAYNNAASTFNAQAAQTPASWIVRSMKIAACPRVEPQVGAATSSASAQMRLL